MDAFIDDGYTKHVGIESVDGLHPEMTFAFRPFAGNESTEANMYIQQGPTALRKNSKDDPRKRRDKILKEQTQKKIQERLMETLAARIQSWAFEGCEDPPEVDAVNLTRLNGVLFTKVNNIVFGWDSPDFELKDGNRTDQSDDEADAKNSTQG